MTEETRNARKREIQLKMFWDSINLPVQKVDKSFFEKVVNAAYGETIKLNDNDVKVTVALKARAQIMLTMIEEDEKESKR